MGMTQTSRSLSDLEAARASHDRTPRRIEDQPAGYPQFAALLGLHPSFYVFRRFSTLRARILLYKQDKLTQLESKLEDVDREEPRVLFHGSARRDKNEARHSLLADIEAALETYDDFLKTTYRALKYKSASPRSVDNLRDWLGDFGCLAKDESMYLSREDLVSLGPSDPDDIFEKTEGFVEDVLFRLASITGKDILGSLTRSADMAFFDSHLTQALTRILLTLIPATILLAPIALVSVIDTLAVRLSVVLCATIVFVMTLSVLAKARLGDMFIAGATYAAVLVAFVVDTLE